MGVFFGSFPCLDLCASTATLRSEFFAAADLVFFLFDVWGCPSLFVSWTVSSGAAFEEKKFLRFLEARRPPEWNDEIRGLTKTRLLSSRQREEL